MHSRQDASAVISIAVTIEREVFEIETRVWTTW